MLALIDVKKSHWSASLVVTPRIPRATASVSEKLPNVSTVNSFIQPLNCVRAIQSRMIRLLFSDIKHLDCPCELNCLDGCDECDNPVCDCEVSFGSFFFTDSLGETLNNIIKVVEENPDWNRCIDDNSLKLGRCVYACENNEECEDDCLSRFKSRQLNCPCEVSYL